DASTDTGLFNDDNFTSHAAPTFTINATPGQTVTVAVNGSGAFNATETSSGRYTVTLPAGQLQVGTNTITATASTDGQPTTLRFTYAPSLQNVYVVPGTPGSAQQVTFTLTSTETSFHSELGYFIVNDFAGHVGSLAPGDAGYVQAAMNARHTLLTPTQN